MLSLEEIKKILPHRYPFLLLDRVLELETGKRCKALKNLTGNEYFFEGHFPGNPVMPGVLIVEALAQACGVAAFSMDEKPETKLMLFAGIEKARFRRPVLPGDQLILETEFVARKLGLWIFTGKAFVNNKMVAQAEIRMAEVENAPVK